MTITFQQLLEGAEVLEQSGNPSVGGVEYDSRQVKPGEVFVALRGELSDGNKFIDQAIVAGAVAIVSDSPTEKARTGVAWAQVPPGRRALARLSANFYHRPAERLAMTGITGTNGKSTVAFLVEAILAVSGRESALIGTIEYHVAGKVLPAPHTTPEALDLNRLLSEALGQGATEAVMEVSSHALAQQRVYGIPFDTAVFTNLTRDHLDYHHTMVEYFASKQMLFEGCGTDAPRAAVLNTDDEYGQKLVKVSKKRSAEVLTYGLTKGDFRAEKVEITPRGTRFDLVSREMRHPVQSPLLGRHNVYNVLAAAAIALEHGITPSEIAAALPSLQPADKRGQVVQLGNITVLYDCYNSSPKALMAAVDTLAAMPARRRIVVAGEMLELGTAGEELHRECGRYMAGNAAGRKLDFLLGVRGLAKPMVDAASEAGMTAEFVATPEEAGEWLARKARDGDVVLLKASRGVKLEKALETWKARVPNKSSRQGLAD